LSLYILCAIVDIFGIGQSSRYAGFKLSAIKMKTKKTSKKAGSLSIEGRFYQTLVIRGKGEQPDQRKCPISFVWRLISHLPVINVARIMSTSSDRAALLG
jgi:hypothetical protein